MDAEIYAELVITSVLTAVRNKQGKEYKKNNGLKSKQEKMHLISLLIPLYKWYKEFVSPFEHKNYVNK